MTESLGEINLSHFEVALCNGTIELELAKLTNRQLGYLKLLICEDETNDLSILDEYIDEELSNRQMKSITANNENKFLTIKELEEKIVSSILFQLEQLANADVLKGQIKEINTSTLRTLEKYLTLEPALGKRQIILDSVQAELNERIIQEKEAQKKLSL